MEIRIGTFLKEINSTKAPDISTTITQGFTNIEVQLKDNVSILSPIILIDDSVYNPAWNYCYIYIWHRFYFLHDAIITTGGIWEVQLGVDVLATWKSYILNASAYVARSASNYSNFLNDNAWSHDTNIQTTETEIDIGFQQLGMFLLYVTTDDLSIDPNSIPAVAVYAVTAMQLKQICSYMFSSAFFNQAKGTMDTTTEAVAKMVFNPFQYITKCMWFPFEPNGMEQDLTTISFGWWDASGGSCQGRIVKAYKHKTSFSFTLGDYNSWIDRSPDWTRNNIYIPGFGQFEISSMYQGKTINGEIIVDLSTGEAGLFLSCENKLIQTASGQVGAEIQLTSLYENVIQDIGSHPLSTALQAASGMYSIVGTGLKRVFSTIGNIFTGNATLSDLVSNTAQNAGSLLEGVQSSLQPTCSTIGANGTRGIISEKFKAIYTLTKYSRYEDIHSKLGGVCNKIHTLSDLSGYTEVINPHVDAPCTSGEVTMINAFMSGGFYLE